MTTNTTPKPLVQPKAQHHNQPKTIYLKDYQPPHYWVDSIDLIFDINDAETEVKSTLCLRRNTGVAQDNTPLILQGEELELKEVILNGKTLEENHFELTSDALIIHAVPETFTLEITNVIHPDKNTALSGLFRSNALYCTQCEAEGFRRITFYPDRPDVMAKFTTTIIADTEQYPVLLSNGNPIEKGLLANNRHWIKWEDPFKKPCYLFALVAGNLVAIEDHFVTRSGRLVTLKIFVEWENQDKCAHAMTALKKAMKWDEDTYGREYDLDIYMIVAVNDFNMGAMENKGLNIFNAKYILARPETATDADFQHVDIVVGHEYFHNWSGNRVTCRDWFQLSLKEGLTVFREHEFMHDISQSEVSTIEHAMGLRSHQFAEDAGPMAHPVRPDSYVEINNFYTSTVYEKGAEVIKMLKILLGFETFRKGMDLYFERFDGQAVTIEDFVACHEFVSKRDLTQFKLWYSQAGTPEIDVKEHYDSKTQTYTLTLQQDCPPTPHQPTKKPMHIPVAMGLLNAQGDDLLANKTQILNLTEKEQSFSFPNLTEKPVLSLLRGFSAPVKLKSSQTNEQLAFLLAHDSDDFNRWEAGQILSTRIIFAMVEDLQKGKTLTLNRAWWKAYEAMLLDKKMNTALKGEMLILPSTSYLVELMDVADTDNIFLAKKFLRREISKKAKAILLEQYRDNLSLERYHYSTESAAKRFLKNLSLSILMENPVKDNMALCMKQWQAANNMTDSLAVLGVLADIDCKEREQVLEEFYYHWQHNPLILNKWFRIQASSTLPNTLECVEKLMQHPAFDITNPNKVYALIGAFSGNMLRFHDKNGKGYTFLADRILQLDPINPQVASRMMSAFTRWRKFDKDRQAKMRVELERIQKTAKLSTDVFEIVTKCLAEPTK